MGIQNKHFRDIKKIPGQIRSIHVQNNQNPYICPQSNRAYANICLICPAIGPFSGCRGSLDHSGYHGIGKNGYQSRRHDRKFALNHTDIASVHRHHANPLICCRGNSISPTGHVFEHPLFVCVYHSGQQWNMDCTGRRTYRLDPAGHCSILLSGYRANRMGSAVFFRGNRHLSFGRKGIEDPLHGQD